MSASEARVQRALSKLRSNQHSDAWQSAVQEARAALDALETETVTARSLPSQRPDVGAYRAELAQLAAPLRDRKAQGSAAEQRAAALGARATSMHDASSSRILDTRRLALESEATGQSILQQLQSQRETIQRTQASHRETDQQLNQSEKILKRMGSWFGW